MFEGINRYAYCLNNPLKYIDPTGYLEADPWSSYIRATARGYTGGYGSFSDQYYDQYYDFMFTGGGGGFSGSGGGGSTSMTFTWHTWKDSHEEIGGEVHITSEKVNHSVTIQTSFADFGTNSNNNAQGAGDDASKATAMWDWGGTVGDEMGSIFLAVAGNAKQDTKYFSKVAATSTGVKQANALRSFSTATKTLSYAKNFGTGMGIIGVGFTFMEGYSDGYMSAGDWTKVGLSAATFIPYVGWAYGLTDLGFKLTTGRSVSDRAGDWVDSW